MGSPYKIKRSGATTILYDVEMVADPVPDFFDPVSHVSGMPSLASGQVKISGIGRAEVTYFKHQDMKMVLKHYYRGGMVARILKDCYLGFSVENTRAFKEFRLLKKMQALDLPVPVAVAAHAEKRLFCFRADLVTQEIEDVKTLAQYLSEKELDEELWKKVGACIRLFHDRDVYHADLNARNILLTAEGDVYLIDFDNSYIRVGTASWKMSNLTRLKRSLLKFQRNAPGFNFDEQGWSWLLEGYG